jgi:hypothetical protein
MTSLILWYHITFDTIDRLFRRSAIPFSLLWLNLITIYLPNTRPYHADVVLAGDGVTDSVLSFLFPDKRSSGHTFRRFTLSHLQSQIHSTDNL